MIADARSVQAGSPRLQALVEIAARVTIEPWTMSRHMLKRWYEAGLSADDVLHAVALSAYFGHLNRIADAVGVPLDYEVRTLPPHADPMEPAWPEAPKSLSGRAALELTSRPATANALNDWRNYMFHRDAPLTRRQRTVIARHVAVWLGDGGISPPDDLTINPLDDALRMLAHEVTLAPWRLSDASFATLREAGFDDAALFDVCATATSAGVFSRIAVAFTALGQGRASSVDAGIGVS